MTTAIAPTANPSSQATFIVREARPGDNADLVALSPSGEVKATVVNGVLAQ